MKEEGKRERKKRKHYFKGRKKRYKHRESESNKMHIISRRFLFQNKDDPQFDLTTGISLERNAKICKVKVVSPCGIEAIKLVFL